MKKILLPTDFSDNALKAVQFATGIAKKAGATIILLHVVEPITDSIRQPYPLQERLQESIANNRLAELTTLKESIAQMSPGISIQTELARGSVTTSVLDFAESSQVDLIVMGTQGATGLKEIFMGSVAADTISRTKIPVLAVPGKCVFNNPDTLLFATKHFEENQFLLNKIVEVARVLAAAIHVAVFLDTDSADAADYIHNSRQLHHYLHFLEKAYPGVAFKAELLEGSDFEETVEKYEVQNEVDMIAIITYPKNIWERLMKKSITKKIAFHSKIPVLAIPASQVLVD